MILAPKDELIFPDDLFASAMIQMGLESFEKFESDPKDFIDQMIDAKSILTVRYTFYATLVRKNLILPIDEASEEVRRDVWDRFNHIRMPLRTRVEMAKAFYAYVALQKLIL